MKILIFTLVALFNMSAISDTHDAVSATFNIIDKGHVLMLEIEFDKFDYLTLSTVTNHKITKADFSTYLHKTTHWEIDGETLKPKVLSIKSERQHTKVICFLSKSKKHIKTVKVKNTFLIDVKEHSNILKLDINNTFKDFRLHKNRIALKVDYN